MVDVCRVTGVMCSVCGVASERPGVCDNAGVICSVSGVTGLRSSICDSVRLVAWCVLCRCWLSSRLFLTLVDKRVMSGDTCKLFKI